MNAATRRRYGLQIAAFSRPLCARRRHRFDRAFGRQRGAVHQRRQAARAGRDLGQTLAGVARLADASGDGRSGAGLTMR